MVVVAHALSWKTVLARVVGLVHVTAVAYVHVLVGVGDVLVL